jgi:hypothetical protein
MFGLVGEKQTVLLHKKNVRDAMTPHILRKTEIIYGCGFSRRLIITSGIANHIKCL